MLTLQIPAKELYLPATQEFQQLPSDSMVLEHSPWLSTWYEQGACLKIPLEEFDLRKVSFTYGDSMPTFSDRCADGKARRRNTTKTNRRTIRMAKRRRTTFPAESQGISLRTRS